MDTFRIKVTRRGSLATEADIYYGDREVGTMERHAKYGYWSNGCGEAYCLLDQGELREIFGEDNPLIDRLMAVASVADSKDELWTMPKTQKAFNGVLRAHRQEVAQ